MNKPKLIALTALAVLSLNFVSCNNHQKKEDQEEVAPPNGVIDSKRALLLQETYTKTRYDTLTKYLKMEDNRSVWFPLEEVENYLKYARQEAAKNNENVTGMRIYMGAYPADDNDETRAGYSTVFIVPTGKSSKNTGSVFSVFQLGVGDLDVSPLNSGHTGNPPNGTYQ
ncbi:MAG: hypothetical protein WBG71_14440 [Leeuwenhoekiella sp.]